jgi:hypothetical protein
MTRLLLAAQGVYYVLTGLWPLASMSAFEAVTGFKTDDWLVKMVGVLAAVIGATLLLGMRRDPPHREVLFLAVAAALGFAAIDVIYTLNGTIRMVYLGDAAVELVLAGALLVCRRLTPPAS